MLSHSVVSNSLWLHGMQHTRIPCRSTSPGVCSNSYPWNQWCHPTILSSVVPFSSCLQSFPAFGSFSMTWLFTSGGQSTGASSLASVLSMNIQGWFPSGLTGLISLQSKELSKVFSSITVWRHRSLGVQPFLLSSLHIHTWLLEKPKLWLYGLLLAKWCLYFLIHCLDCHNFIPKSKHLLLSWLQSPSVVILEPKKIKSVTVSLFPYLFAMKWWDQMLWA